MKKGVIGIFLLIVSFCLQSTVYGQEDVLNRVRQLEKKETRFNKKFRWGLNFGVNLVSYNKTDFDTKITVKPGVNFEIFLTKNFSINTGLYYNKRGANKYIEHVFAGKEISGAETFVLTTDEKLYFSPVYLDLPVLFTYKKHLDALNSIYLSVGPYVSYGLSGELTTKRLGETQSVSLFEEGVLVYSNTNNKDLHFNLDYNRWIYGAMIEAGYEYEKFRFSIAYDLGLSDIANSEKEVWYFYQKDDVIKNSKILVGNTGLKHRCWQFSISYFF